MHKIKISLYTDSAKFHNEIAAPWEICGNAPAIIAAWIKPLSDDYAINDCAEYKRRQAKGFENPAEDEPEDASASQKKGFHHGGPPLIASQKFLKRCADPGDVLPA